jgi:hypothetical protein
MLQIMQDVTSLCVNFIKNLVKDSTTELHGFGSTPVYKQAQQATKVVFQKYFFIYKYIKMIIFFRFFFIFVINTLKLMEKKINLMFF